MKKYKFKIGNIKFFVTPNQHENYLAEWYSGYVQFWNEWDQIDYKRFNWLTFVLVEFEIERQLGEGLTVELGLLGFRLRIYHQFNESEFAKKLAADAKRAKKRMQKKCMHRTITGDTLSKEVKCGDCKKVLGKITDKNYGIIGE